MARTGVAMSAVAVLLLSTGVFASEEGVTLRGNSVGRRLQEGRCNSIGCPGGYIPIPNAWDVECGGECTVELCCDAFCWGYPCPNGFIPNPETNNDMCTDTCSTDKCCMAHAGTGPNGENLAGPLCNSVGCQNGAIPIPNAQFVECSGGVCTQEECCDLFCWSHPCPNGFIPNPNTNNDMCTDECTDEKCCVAHAGTGPNGENLAGPLCNSIGCQNGAIPIPDAQFVECSGGVCTQEECCDLFCWSHPCPNGFIPNPETNNNMCTDTCSTDECCMAHAGNGPNGENLAGPLCNSIGCQNGAIPIPDAQFVECSGGVCTQEECCDLFCWSHPCPNGFIPNPETNNNMCTDTCSTDECCMAHAGNGPNGENLAGPLCNSIGCQNGAIPILNAQFVECSGGVCTQEECCDLFCWSHPCPNGFIPNPDTVDDMCTDECSTDKCCLAHAGNGPNGENLAGPLCNSIGCLNGAIPIQDAQFVECSGGVCTQEECCDSYCSFHPCPNMFTPIPMANETLCADSGCTTGLCCEALCSGFPCGDGLIPIPGAHMMRCSNDMCTNEECCTTVLRGNP